MDLSDATFRTTDGVSLRYTLRRNGHRRVVLVVPGILMHRTCDEHRLLAQRLSAMTDVATLDVRGHGDSGGWFTWGRREPSDVAALADALRTSYPRIGGLGFSFGGYHSCVAAALHRPFDALATVAAPRRLFVFDHNPFIPGLWRSMPLLLRRQRRLTRLSLLAWLRSRTTPAHVARRVSPTPWMIVHGTQDWLVPAKHARRLYASAAEPKQLVLLEGGLHAETMLLDRPDALLDPLLAFFDERL